MTTPVIFYLRYPELKKNAQDTSIFGQVTVFVFGRPDLKRTFQFRAVSDRTRNRTPLRLSRARSRETALSPFSDTVFTMKTLFYSNHCELCTKYKSLTAIPDFQNDDILFICGAIACYKKRGNLPPNARR